MKSQIFAFSLIFCALMGMANADDKLYFYIECSPGLKCIALAFANGGKESVVATPALALSRAEIESASVQMAGNTPQSLRIELTKEASEKLEKITRGNVGKKLYVVLGDTILTAPTIQAPVTSRSIVISSQLGAFWEKVPWLQALIKDSVLARADSVVMHVIIALAVSISAFAFVLLPRRKRSLDSKPE